MKVETEMNPHTKEGEHQVEVFIKLDERDLYRLLAHDTEHIALRVNILGNRKD